MFCSHWRAVVAGGTSRPETGGDVMTTGRPRSSERTTFRGLRCLQTPFGQALAANGREHPTPGRGRGNQYDVIRSGCPEQTCLPRTTPAALAPTAAPEDPPWHLLSACAETAPFHQPHDSHTDMPVAHQPTSPAAVWLFVAESLRKLLDRGQKRATHGFVATKAES